MKLLFHRSRCILLVGMTRKNISTVFSDNQGLRNDKKIIIDILASEFRPTSLLLAHHIPSLVVNIYKNILTFVIM